MQRIAVIAKLRPGTAEQADELIELGPPFDLLENGLERHMVFLAADTAVFVFEGGDPHAVIAALNADERGVGTRRVGAAGRRHSEDRPRGVLWITGYAVAKAGASKEILAPAQRRLGIRALDARNRER